MKRMLEAMLVTGALSLLTAVPSARAALLQSGTIFNAGTGPAVFCFASNLGPKPVTVLGVRGIGEDGMPVAVSSVGPTACLPAPVQPGATCEFETAATIVRMEIEIKGSAKKVRARCTVVSDGVPRDSVELR